MSMVISFSSQRPADPMLITILILFLGAADPMSKEILK